jgi:type VI secretion system lysozyme-like protein
MASDRGLFDRLRDPDRSAARSVHQRTDRIYGSVLRHLQHVLNTRHDDSPAAPELGLPALSDVDISTRAEDLRRAIEQAIRSYEPRLAGVRVLHVPADEGDPLKIRFQITGRLATADERVTVRFDTLVDAAGSWKVSG